MKKSISKNNNAEIIIIESPKLPRGSFLVYKTTDKPINESDKPTPVLVTQKSSRVLGLVDKDGNYLNDQELGQETESPVIGVEAHCFCSIC